MSGGRVFVGAPFDDTPAGVKAGSVVVFEQRAGDWTSEAVRPAEGAADGWFGFALATGGGRIGVGGYYAAQASGPEAGSAFVLERRTDGGWDVRPLAPRVRPERKDHFGRALAFVGDTVFVGAEEDDNVNGRDAGGVFALRLDRPEAPPRLVVPSDGAPTTYFGYLLAATDRVLAGSMGARVYLFSGPGGGVLVERTLEEVAGAPLAGSVSAMAGEGRRLVIGSASADRRGPSSGAVVVFDFAR